MFTVAAVLLLKQHTKGVLINFLKPREKNKRKINKNMARVPDLAHWVFSESVG